MGRRRPAPAQHLLLLLILPSGQSPLGRSATPPAPAAAAFSTPPPAAAPAAPHGIQRPGMSFRIGGSAVPAIRERNPANHGRGGIAEHIAGGPPLLVARASSGDDEGGGGETTREEGPFLGGGPVAKRTAARAGGRSSTPKQPKNKSDGGGALVGLAKAAAPILVGLAVLRALLGGVFGGPASPGYVYYQSSLYESRTMGPDGNMETTRKESVRSNVPSLLGGEREGSAAGSYLLLEDPDNDIDREIDEAIRRSMRLEESITRSLFNDFF